MFRLTEQTEQDIIVYIKLKIISSIIILKVIRWIFKYVFLKIIGNIWTVWNNCAKCDENFKNINFCCCCYCFSIRLLKKHENFLYINIINYVWTNCLQLPTSLSQKCVKCFFYIWMRNTAHFLYTIEMFFFLNRVLRIYTQKQDCGSCIRNLNYGCRNNRNNFKKILT